MTNLAYPTRDNGASEPATVRRGPFADMFGFDPLDLFRNFYSPLALDATAAQGGLDITRTDNIRAHVEHGLLTLSLNRRPEAEPKRINITVNYT
jgi:hypothetical protein